MNLKPTPPSQTALFSEMKKLANKIDTISTTLQDQGANTGSRRDLGGWTTIKTAGTDVDAEAPWHGPGSHPKNELTKHIWVFFRTIKKSQNQECCYQ